MVNIIKGCPDIEFLSLEGLCWENNPSDVHSRWRPIDLLQLRTLIINDVSLVLTEAVIMSINRIPKCAYFSVYLTFDGDDNLFSLHDALHHLIPDIQRILQLDGRERVTGPHLCVKFANHGFACFPVARIPDTFLLHVDGFNSHRIDDVRFVVSLVEGTSAQISILADKEGIDIEPGGLVEGLELLQVAQQLPVTQLRLRDLVDWDEWFMYLSSFQQDGERGFAHPFRGITQITCSKKWMRVNRPILCDDMLAMVTRRYSDTKDTVAQGFLARGLEYIAPLPLGKLVYRGKGQMPENMPNMFEDILGAGVFEVLPLESGAGSDEV